MTVHIMHEYDLVSLCGAPGGIRTFIRTTDKGWMPPTCETCILLHFSDPSNTHVANKLL